MRTPKKPVGWKPGIPTNAAAAAAQQRAQAAAQQGVAALAAQGVTGIDPSTYTNYIAQDNVAQYLKMTPQQLAQVDPATLQNVAYKAMNTEYGTGPNSVGARLDAAIQQANPQAYTNAYNTSAQVAASHQAGGLSAFLGQVAPLAIGAALGGVGAGALGLGAIGTGAAIGGGAGLVQGATTGNPIGGALTGAALGAAGGSLFSALDAPATGVAAGLGGAAPAGSTAANLGAAASGVSTGADAATMANFGLPAAGTSAIQPGIAGGALPAASAADVASMASGMAAQGASASAISSTLASMGVPGTVADAAASLGTSGMNAADLGSFLGTGSTAGVSAAGSSILQSLGSIAGGPVGKLIGALAPAAGAAIGALTGPSIPQLPNQAQAGASLYGAISAYPGQAAQYAGTNPQYANQAFQSQFNNPYAGQALQGAQQAGQMATGAAGQAYGSGQSLLNAQNQILQSSMDPQQALYNQLLQQTTDQTRAGEAARGLAMSPIGSQIESNALNQFNIDWQNQQLNRQIAGANAAGTAGRTGVGLQGVGTQYMQQGSQYPYTQAQNIAQNQFGAIGANQAAMQGGLAPQQQNIQNLGWYTGLGGQSAINAANLQNYNAQTGAQWGNLAASGLGSIAGLFPSGGTTNSGSSGLFPASGSNTSLAFAGGSNYGTPLL